MPVDIDGAEAGLEVEGRDRYTTTGVNITLVAHGDIAACLLKGVGDAIYHALDISEVSISWGGILGFLTFAGISTGARVVAMSPWATRVPL